jgi:hypothetical protein
MYSLSLKCFFADPFIAQEETRRVMMLSNKAMGMFVVPALTYDPCEDVDIATYLNRVDVQRALHIVPNATGTAWADCTNDPRWNYQYSDFYNVQVKFAIFV